MFKNILIAIALMGATYSAHAAQGPRCEWPMDPSAAAGNYDPYARAVSNMANADCKETVEDHIAGLLREQAELQEIYSAGMAVIQKDPGACYGCMPRMAAMKRQLALYPAAIAAARKYPGAASAAEAARSYAEDLKYRAQRGDARAHEQFVRWTEQTCAVGNENPLCNGWTGAQFREQYCQTYPGRSLKCNSVARVRVRG